MNAITKRKALNEVFKQLQRLPEWRTEKNREPTQLEPKSPLAISKQGRPGGKLRASSAKKGTISRS
jgi:hypothetical protein